MFLLTGWMQGPWEGLVVVRVEMLRGVIRDVERQGQWSW